MELLLALIYISICVAIFSRSTRIRHSRKVTSFSVSTRSHTNTLLPGRKQRSRKPNRMSSS